ncbi:glycosyltransferase [Tateyamaria sp. SN6-1]|uniref:glycosyltransferase n=1 Tax=Tateyamaria sp. SN6-1 TaxID=3092148 RepID=UPI0039F4BEDD
MAGQSTLVAVVVTHNRLDQLRTTLARLRAADPDHLTCVVVVDCASTDGTQAWLDQQDDPRLNVLRSDRNIGGAGGFEMGLRHAVAAHDPDWMVLMDDDARPAPDALSAFMTEPRDAAHAWAAAVYHPDGRICDINRPWQNPFWHRDVFWRTFREGRGGFHLGASAYEAKTPLPLDGTSFVGFFVSRDGVALAGYPDASLFIYGDDVLYTLGLSERGGTVMFDPRVRFEHDFSTQGTADKRMRPMWKIYYHHRNLLLVYRRAAGLWFWPVLLLILPKWLMKIRHYRGERGLFLRLMTRAIWDGLRRDTALSHERLMAVANGTRSAS